MRTLFVSPSIPDPLDSGGSQRMFHLLQGLARVSDVTFVSGAHGGKHRNTEAAFRKLCSQTVFFPSESRAQKRDAQLPRLLRWGKAVVRHISSREPVLLQSFRSQEGAVLVEKLCQQPFDLIWVQRILPLNWLPAYVNARVVVDLDDLEHRKLLRELTINRPSKRTVFDYWEYVKLRRFEQKHLPMQPWEFVVCSETDRRILGGGPNIWVVPNGVKLVGCDEGACGATGDPIFTFVGLMEYAPNVDAVQYFTREILPLIRRELPTAKLFIVGKNPEAPVRRLHDGKTVIVTGTVPEVVPYLRQSSVSIVPLRIGGGTRIKILEAMACRCPVVSTSIGAEGLEVKSSRHLLIADTPLQFAEACVKLHSDNGLRERIIGQAFELVRTRYDWSMIERDVEKLVLAGPNRPTNYFGHIETQEGNGGKVARSEELITEGTIGNHDHFV